jgi:hypothetical protein
MNAQDKLYPVRPWLMQLNRRHLSVIRVTNSRTGLLKVEKWHFSAEENADVQFWN